MMERGQRKERDLFLPMHEVQCAALLRSAVHCRKSSVLHLDEAVLEARPSERSLFLLQFTELDHVRS